MGAYELSLSSYSYSSSNDKLADEITLLAGQINAANYQFLKLIAEFDRREAWASAGIRSCAHWLNWKCGIAIGAAREKVRVARCLEKLPKINEAFSSGILSFSKVRAMTRVAHNDNEEYLLMIAEHGTASHIEKLVGKFQKVETHQNKSQEEQHSEERKMVSYQDDDGMWHIHAKLPAEAGALVVKAIDAIMNEQKEQQQEQNVSAETSSEETTEEFPFDQKRVDALAMMAEHYLATKTNEDGVKTLAGSERCQVMLHVDINTLQSNGSDSCCTHKHSNLDNKHWISPQTAKRLSCDASLVTVLEDEKGNVLNIGRRSRTIPPSIYRALSLRDTTCRHPGCCATNYLDAHHIVHWANGGETCLDNLVMLCRHHHRGLHRGEFHIMVEDSDIVFTTT
ncbi:MAG: DUF222 domain-containing protein, partial [Gammaproteobacteria bacterium]|nr:DUF222 domain-containing protein [Gammaproteobacteria bacterium]